MYSNFVMGIAAAGLIGSLVTAPPSHARNGGATSVTGLPAGAAGSAIAGSAYSYPRYSGTSPYPYVGPRYGYGPRYHYYGPGNYGPAFYGRR
jgi:hypothetical protein